jgi:hypothetical protein
LELMDELGSTFKHNKGVGKLLKDGKFSEGIVESWDKLSPLTGKKAWVSKSAPLLEKLEGKSPAFKDNLKNYYSNHQRPSTMIDDPPAIHNGIQFDDFGHPDFTPHVPKMFGNQEKIKYVPSNDPESQNLTGNSVDMDMANTWAILKYNINGQENFRLSNVSGRCQIKDEYENWVECVWHHHEDGKTMMPIPTAIHNRGGNGTAHTGGNTILQNNQSLIGFFPPPSY